MPAMEITDARNDPRYWHARYVMERHQEEMARALIVTPAELDEYARGLPSPRIAAGIAEGRPVLVRDDSASDAGSDG